MKIISNISIKLILLVGLIFSFSSNFGQCVVQADSSQQGSFNVGYRGTIQTTGNDVVIAYELLDTNRSGIVAYLWEETPFTETPMTFVSGQTFTITLSGQTIGQTIGIGCKFAFAGGLAVSSYYDYTVGDNCVLMSDSIAPTNFTASVGQITSNSVEFLVNGTDDSGTLRYTASNGTDSVSVNGTSGSQTSLNFTGLSDSTAYTFSVRAKDLIGNPAPNNPIVLNATTLAAGAGNSGVCEVNADSAQQGNFDIGYYATFETVGSDVIITYELLDTNKTGVVAYLWQESPFSETPMTLVSGQEYTITLSGQTLGNTLGLAVKFAYAGGLSVSNYYDYTVGDNCIADTINPTNFTASIGEVKAFSVEILLNGLDNSGVLEYSVTDGVTTKTTSGSSGAQTSLWFNKLTPFTTYNFTAEAFDPAGNAAINNPIPLTATTVEDSSTNCEGTSYVTQADDFTDGYNYKFETVGNDVICTFELIDDDKVGLVAFLWEQVPFVETAMTLVSGRTYTHTLTNQTQGQLIGLACKFAYAGGASITKYIPYTVGDTCVYENVIGDTIRPFNFAAVAGEVTPFSIELLMNGEDNAGGLFYTINNGAELTTIPGDSAEQVSHKYNKLMPSTTYTYFVEARDSAGNEALNNPIELSITTLPDSSDNCSGASYEASEGDFEIGYNYHFETDGSNVNFTFELLDESNTVTASMLTELPNSETPMTLTSGQIFTNQMSGVTVGQNVVLACKFSIDGKDAITKYFIYKVGDKCDGTEIITLNDNEEFNDIKVYPNPANSLVHIVSSLLIDKIELYSIEGAKLKAISTKSNQIDVSRLNSGTYILRISSQNNVYMEKLNIF